MIDPAILFVSIDILCADLIFFNTICCLIIYS